MSKVVVINHLTIDGVMQAPGTPDEVMGRFMGEGMAGGGALLLGRWTYEKFAAYRPKQRDNPFTPVLNEPPQVCRVANAASRCRAGSCR